MHPAAPFGAHNRFGAADATTTPSMLTMSVVAQAEWQLNNNHSTYPCFIFAVWP